MDRRSRQSRPDHSPDPPEVHPATKDQRQRVDPARSERPCGQQVDAGRPHLWRRPERGWRPYARFRLCQFPQFGRLLVLHSGQFSQLVVNISYRIDGNVVDVFSRCKMFYRIPHEADGVKRVRRKERVKSAWMSCCPLLVLPATALAAQEVDQEEEEEEEEEVAQE